MHLELPRFVAFGCTFALLTGGCLLGSADDDDLGSGSAGDSADDGGDDGPDPAAGIDLQGCRGDTTDAEYRDTIAIIDDYGQSLHEMVACGGLNVVLCSSVVNGVIDAIVTQSTDATPPGWTFQGDGVYYTNGGMADMTTQFFLAEDFEFGRSGDLLTENLFLVDSYLVGAGVEITDIVRGEGLLHFDAPGPYVELLGFGAHPQSPLAIDLNDLSNLSDGLGALVFESSVTVDDPRTHSTVHYEVETSRMPAGALIKGSAMEFGLKQAYASRQELAQELIVDAWEIRFVGGNLLDGDVVFHVDGRHFPYRGRMVFDRSSYADPELECP